MLARETTLLGLHAPVNFRCNDVGGPFPATFLNDFPKFRFYNLIIILDLNTKRVNIEISETKIKLPECASDISNILMPLSTANLSMASACSSETPGENTGQVPSPTFDTRKPLLPKFL